MINLKILKIANNTKYFGLEKKFTHKARIKNPKCGDKIDIEIITKRNKINLLRYETDACIFCQASASILANKIKSFSILELKKDLIILKDQINRKNYNLPKRFKVFKDLINKDNINRIECIMLPLNAIAKALKYKL